MATRKRAVTSESGAYMSQYDQEVEKRLSSIEEKLSKIQSIDDRLKKVEDLSHEKCSGGKTKVEIKVPSAPPRKSSSLHDRVDSLEKRLETIISLLS